MKSINSIITRSSSSAFAALAIAALAVAIPAGAQSQFANNDGIAASPKVRAQMHTRSVEPARDAAPAMACPKCKDGWAAQTAPVTKGLGAASMINARPRAVATHLCGACATNWRTVGTGKARTAVASHQCGACDADSAGCVANVTMPGMGR